MKKHNPRILMGFAILALVFALLFAAAPVQSVLARGSQFDQGAALLQDPPAEPPVEVQPTIVIVPDTGGGNQTNIFLDSWLIWVILGAVILALLAALIGRGSSTTHHHD